MTTREVVLEGGSPWGFRIHGGVDSSSLLRISKLNPNGKAASKGIQEGDIISTINGHSTANFTCSEAHNFIKNSGDTLKLELINDSGSARQQRKRNKPTTIHETNSETVKSTSSTLYSRISSKTVFCDGSNDYSEPGGQFRKQPSLEAKNRSRDIPDPPVSPTSTVSSDVSSSSTLTEAGNDERSIRDVTTSTYNIEMPNHANSNSKKKRSRKQKNKSKKASEYTKDEPKLIRSTLGETSVVEEAAGVVYKVDFPGTTVTPNPKVKVKSRSLDDDDDSLKIEEVTECNEDTKPECDAVISEADSDWEEATDLRVPQTPISLSTVAISIDEEPLQRIEILSPEEELSLRNFLEDINLVSVAERPSTKSTLETIKSEKARKREALAKYFKPLVYNPRYLDIISEEGSDLSDKETSSLTLHLKQGTPELENVPNKPSPKPTRRRELKRLRLPQTKDRAVLVCTKVIETPSVIEHVHTRATENIEAETVFIESTSTSSKDSSDSDEVSLDENEADDSSEKTEKISEHQRVPADEIIENHVDLTNAITKTKLPELEIDVENNHFIFEPEQRENEKSSTQTPNTDSNSSKKMKTVIPAYYDELTPPPTPDSSPKCKVPDVTSIDLNECMIQISNDAAKDITSVLCKLTQASNLNVIVNQAFVMPSEKSINLISSRSPSKSSSSSRETSPSTVRVNQMNSSIADVRSIAVDLELAKEASFFKQPLTLRQICLNCLLSLPCGAEMLQELSDISFNLDKLTQALNQTQTMLASDASARVSNHESISDSTNTMWTGLPFQSTPNLLLCLSPTQKVHLDKSGVLSTDPEKLFDLHSKFMNRVDQNQVRNNSRNNIEMTSLQNVVIGTADEANHVVDSSTLPRNFKPNMDNPRLQVSNLNDWLTIARNDKVHSQHETDTMLESKVTTLPHSSSNDNNELTRRRCSLPDDLCERQMQYILEKEKEIEKELEDLLEEKRKLYLEMENYDKNNNFGVTADKIEKNRPKSYPTAPSETFRQKMYEEYMNQVAEREERKQKKVIKITSSPSSKSTENGKPIMEVTHLPEIEDEFMKKVQQLHGPLHKVEEEEASDDCETLKSSEFSEHESVMLMDGSFIKNVTSLPKHLREFVEITSECSKVENHPDSTNDAWYERNRDEDDHDSWYLCLRKKETGVWSPGQKQEFTSTDIKNHQRNENDNEAIPTIWRPKSATSSPSAERKEFRAVNFESPKLSRKNKSEEVLNNLDKSTTKPPWQTSISGNDTGQSLSSIEKQFPNCQLTSVAGYNDFTTSRLPKAQNPTITLLQKAREGQLPRGATYIEANRDHYNIPHESGGQGEILRPRRSDFYSESDNETSRRMVDASRRNINGVGPMTKDGMPLSLRSEVKDSNQSRWYKKMYDTIHKQKPYRDEYVTVRYKQRRAQYPYITGYLSEPEPSAYDSDHMDYKYATLDRRRTPMSEKENFSTSTMPRNTHLKTSSSFDAFQYNPGSKVNPGRIENYMPGHSSIQEQESKRWWDEVMDIFDGWMDDVDDFDSNFEDEKKPITKGYMSQALKESGYESDSTLIFKRKEEGSQLSPSEQKEAYRIIQKGGDIPLHGLRRAAPERPKENSFRPVSPSYTESPVGNIFPQQEIFCYPVTVHPKRQVFADFKKTAPPALSTNRPPSPPKRRSSRNNTTLRLITTMKVPKEKLPICKRHEICFTSTSNGEKSNVKYLRDKISCKLSPMKTKKSVKLETSSTSEVHKSSGDHGSSKNTNKIKSEPCSSKDSKYSKTCSSRTPSKGSKKVSSKPVGTFGTEKRKILLNLPKFFEEKKPYPPSTTSVKDSTGRIEKETKIVPSSPKNSPIYAKDLGVNVNEDGKRTFPRARTPSPLYNPKTRVRCRTASPMKATTIESSWESLKSPTLVRKERAMRSISNMKKDIPSATSLPKKDLRKSKKEEINGKIASKKVSGHSGYSEKMSKTKEDPKVRNRKIDNGVNQFGSNTLLSEIQRRHKDVHSDRFFQHLFLGDEVAPPSVVRRNCWMYEKPFGTSKDPPTQHNARAMKMYLNHTKPVTDSKFRNNDIRTRSVSPKSLTFEKKFDSIDSMDRIGRSISLPPKLIHFSETSRPVSPVILRRNAENRTSPVPSVIARSPSQRKIDALKQTQNVYFKREECTSPSISSGVHKQNFEITKDPKEVLNGLSSFTTRCTKFKDLNEFYSTLEKLGELERMANNAENKIRKKSEGEIVDYDRWKEVHQKERAEKEIDYLCEKLKKKEEDEGFLFRPKGVINYKWKCELDRGLRIREKSVENIKKELEKLKVHDQTHIEKFYQAKDTYKPLWRGSSVLNLASHMVARRSQSEGRVPQGYQKFSSSDKLLTRGIGSRIWSSLSVDQVNILKEQLTEIYDQNSSKQKKVPEFNIYVPSEYKSTLSHLTVRRNSDVPKPPCVYKNRTDVSSSILSETEKKRISQSLGNEVMSRITKTPPPSRLNSPDCSVKNVAHITNKNTKSHAIGKSSSDGQLLKPSNIEMGKTIKKIKHVPKKNEVIVASGSDSGKEGRIKSSESGSTDESTKTVIFVEKKEDIKKKVDYFEKASEKSEYIPIVHKPAEEDLDNEEKYSPGLVNSSISNSCQDFKELFGEKEIARLTTRPLSASRKSTYTSPSLQLRTTSISPCKLSISDGASCDSLYRSRSLSPFFDEPQSSIKSGEVRRLKDKFEYVRSYYSNGLSLKPRRCFSDSNLYKQSAYLPALTHVDVDSLRKKYEYPVHAGRGRSRIRRGGVVSPVFLRAEDRFMPHINIISKIATLCSKKFDKTQSPSDEQLGEILNLKSGDVEKLKELFDKRSDISLLGKMFTSSPDIKELRDIAPYLTGSWTAHRFPRTTENTISLISPGESVASMDTSLVRKAPTKSTSLQGTSKSSILKSHQRTSSAELPSKKATGHSNDLKFDTNLDEVRYRTHWTSVHSKPSVTFKEPEPPLPPPKGHHGPRETQQGSPKKYVENQVTIHYKTPVRQEIKDYYSEDELAHRQQEAMKKIYQEERRRKYLQELQDMHNRRHTDNFISSQKSPIALNRYDDFDDLVTPPQIKTRPKSPEPRLVARALYNFVGMTPRELTFRKGDNIYVRRQIDKNWYEGELNAMVGLFPVNYVEIIPYENVRTTPRKPHEGQARAKYNFLAKTHLELSLAKGEMVIITRRVDSNWYEGKIGGRRGIFPASYVDVLIDPQEAIKDNPKPIAAPAAHSLLLNGTHARESMGSHTYTPNISNPESASTPKYFAKPVQTSYNSYENRSSVASKDPMSQALHIDTQSAEPTCYKALYKYLPQNDDELELMEGDKIYVLEKCDDGWYVGSNERTGAFGTFPGNYVDRI